MLPNYTMQDQVFEPFVLDIKGFFGEIAPLKQDLCDEHTAFTDHLAADRLA
jgi:hypothetical protein